jgi:hypothetical protein
MTPPSGGGEPASVSLAWQLQQAGYTVELDVWDSA